MTPRFSMWCARKTFAYWKHRRELIRLNKLGYSHQFINLMRRAQHTALSVYRGDHRSTSDGTRDTEDSERWNYYKDPEKIIMHRVNMSQDVKE